MKLYQYTIILLMLIIVALITREITIMFYKCPPCLEQKDVKLSFKDNFIKMFENASPWPGINQTLYKIKKKEQSNDELLPKKSNVESYEASDVVNDDIDFW